MVDLGAALTALKAADIGCTGFSLLQSDDSSTWTFFGVSLTNRPVAVGIIQQLAVGPAHPSSQFWPSQLQTLADEVDRIKRHVGLPNA